MTRFKYLILFAIVLSLLISAGCLHEQQASGGVNNTTAIRHGAMQMLLHEMTGTIQDNLDAFNFSIDEVSYHLGEHGLSGIEADTMMMDLATCHPATLSAITVDPNGTVLSAAPDNARVLLGQNIADQDAISQVLSTRKPVMSKYFPLRQGGAGVAIVYPVFAPDGNFLGGVSLAFSPSLLIERYAEESKTWAPFTYVVAQPDGVLLYQNDPLMAEIWPFNEMSIHRSSQASDFIHQYSRNRSGYFNFLTGIPGYGKTVVNIEKETFWNTVELHGTEWRVLVIAEKE